MSSNASKTVWQKLIERYGYRRVRALIILLAIGLMAGTVQVLFIGDLGQSSLLYMLVPYSFSLLLAATRTYQNETSRWQRYLRHLVTTIVVFLAASIILREGFICVVMFFPIYVIFVSLAFAAGEFANRRQAKKNRVNSAILPLLVVVLSMEGTSDFLSFPRENVIQRTLVTSHSVDQIKSNIVKPFELEQDRNWLLEIFPMPYLVDKNVFADHEIHVVKTRYHRWFIANTHEGQAELKVQAVGDNVIRTELLSDTTYFANYLEMHGTEIRLTPLADGRTQIDFSIAYRRKLDPAWYFHPLQQYAVGHMADLMIKEFMTRG